MIFQSHAKVIKNKAATPEICILELDDPHIAGGVRPGQFLHIRVDCGAEPLLRRPLSVCALKKNPAGKHPLLVIIYKIVGKGTRMLGQKRRGEYLDVLGPLGRGFDLRPVIEHNRPVLLAAGGMGAAPLVFLAQTLRRESGNKLPMHAFIGSAAANELFFPDLFRKAGGAVHTATEDGSRGFKGYVSELVREHLSGGRREFPSPYIYACGPLPMLKEMDALAAQYGCEGQVCVDEMMGCGVGACLGCVIKIKARAGSEKQYVYKRICRDGPVFGINEIFWED